VRYSRRATGEQGMPTTLPCYTRLSAGKERLLENSRSFALASHQKYPIRAAVPNNTTSKSNVGIDNPVGFRRCRLASLTGNGSGINMRTIQKIARIVDRTKCLDLLS
jgi:hypothetical protein